MKNDEKNYTIEGEQSPCGDRTNDGDELFQKVFEKETGQDFAQKGVQNAPPTGRSLGQALRK